MDLPIPKSSDREVLIRVAAASINPVDILLSEGFAGSRPPHSPVVWALTYLALSRLLEKALLALA